ncbi:MAG TPA: acetyl-CoA carboxylase biotin carboxyl carrier protein [Candidatus Dormibacteraeota bacterium]|nr:acetyl-CoA carboxylase biotin carboxyl carrier protein [Candidatus Dormibacteraeota bacterium]
MARRRSARSPADPAPLSIEQVVELAVRHNLAELEVEGAGTRIRIVREHAPAASGPRVEAAPAIAAPLQQPTPESVESTAHLLTVEAPMVGTFYRSPKPDAPPFVTEGDVVKEGQVICIVEAMKLMNEIESKVAGRIAKVVVENGQPVEFGQALFLVEPLR